jgi:Glycosyltransferase family 28 C-terminal domain.
MIAFYISSHGFGHLTRTLVHIEKYLNETEEKIYLASGFKQVEFAKVYLENYEKRLTYEELTTDIGLINKKNSLEVDKAGLEEELHNFIKSWDEVVNQQIKALENKKIKKIVVDISSIGILVGDRMKVSVEAISNFTWYNQYDFLNLDESIIRKFYEVDQKITKFFVYPLSLNLSHLKCEKESIDYVCRPFDYTKINKIKKEHKKIVFIGCGKSAHLEQIEVKNFEGTIFFTDGIKIGGEGRHILLPIETKDTQNYIAASDFIITKAGWGTVAEAFLSKVPMVLIEREGVLEDSYTINELKKQNKAMSIKLEELKILDMEILEQEIINLIIY